MGGPRERSSEPRGTASAVESLLEVPQWLIRTAVALSIVVAAEIRRASPWQTAAKATPPAPRAAATTGECPSGA